ncbi:MAG TPA: hypothetical protein VGE24_11500 [Emticicia sp.]
MKYLFLLFFLFFFSCEKKREIAQIKFKAYSVELPDEFKQVRIDSKSFATTYYFSNGDTLDFVNDPMEGNDLLYKKKNDSTYIVKIEISAPEGGALGGKIYTDSDNILYLSFIEEKKPKMYRGLTTHIVTFEISTNMRNPRFRNNI